MLARRARGRGVRLIIDSDAHSPAALGNLRWGVAVARRAWLEPQRRPQHATDRRLPGLAPAPSPLTAARWREKSSSTQYQTSVQSAEILAEIRALYFKTSSKTIERDFDRAIDLLKSIPLPEDRQRATVFMEGLAEMRKDWKRRKRPT